MKKILVALFLLLVTPLAAQAQALNTPCFPINSSAGSCAKGVQPYRSVKIDINGAATTRLIELVAGQAIYISSWDVMAAGAGTFKLVYGTGATCGTGTVDLTGAYPLAANGSVNKGSGTGNLYNIPQGNSLCATTTGAVQFSGAVSYSQF